MYISEKRKADSRQRLIAYSKKAQAIQNDKSKGLTIAQLATKYKISESSVRRMLRC